MQVIECVQKSPEWFLARCGKVTASRISDVMASGRGSSESITRGNYLWDLVLERYHGKPRPEGFKNSNTDRGDELEQYAREEYGTRNGSFVETVGFVLHSTIKNYGCSPDGIVSSKKGIQIKCPIPRIHWSYIQKNVVPAEYVPQMLSEIDTCEWEESDFVSYCPDFPTPMNLFVKTLQRNDGVISEYRKAVIKFDGEVETLLANLRSVADAQQ